MSVNHINSLLFVYYFSKPRKTRKFYPTEIIVYTVYSRTLIIRTFINRNLDYPGLKMTHEVRFNSLN